MVMKAQQIKQGDLSEEGKAFMFHGNRRTCPTGVRVSIVVKKHDNPCGAKGYRKEDT